MKKAILFLSFIIFLTLAGCASVGGVEVTTDDTWFTVSAAVGGFITILWAKAWIEYRFNRKLERYKKELDDQSK